MPRGFAGERESERANDPSGFGGGFAGFTDDKPSDNIVSSPAPKPASTRTRGRLDGPGSITEGNPVSGLDALVDQINKDIASGVNVGGDTYQNKLAQGILSGSFGDREEFGIQTPSFADTALSTIGYDPQQTFGKNVVDMVVPGRNTPLGALSALPSVMGASKAVSGLTSLANAIMGKINLRPVDTGGITSGIDSITEKYLDPVQPFTGRPDDAPAGVVTPGSMSGSGFTTVAGRVTDTPPNPATETDAEFNARMDKKYGGTMDELINQARIEDYFGTQGDVGVYTQPLEQPIYEEGTMLTSPIDLLPQNLGGFADPLLGSKTLQDALNERVINEKLQRELDKLGGLRREIGSFRSDLSGVPNAFNTLSPRAIARKNLLSGRPFQEL